MIHVGEVQAPSSGVFILKVKLIKAASVPLMKVL